MLHDAAPARLSAYFVSFGFVPPYLSQPPARGIYRLWEPVSAAFGKAVPFPQRRGL